VGGAYSMNGAGERSAECSCETMRWKGTTWKICLSREHIIVILIEKKKDSKVFNLKFACNSSFEEII